jgi:CMP-N-acetylneuraminic acid synthetase
MLRPFAGSSLFDIHLKKLAELYDGGLFCGWGMGIPQDDTRLIEKARQAGIPVLIQTQATGSEPGKRSEELHFLEGVDATHIMWVNACLPLQHVDTLNRAVETFHDRDYLDSIEPVVPRYNWYWGRNSHPLNKHATSSQKTGYILESTQGFHIFSREYMLEHSHYWNPDDTTGRSLMQVFVDDDWLDIDTQQQFELVEIIYNRRMGKS